MLRRYFSTSAGSISNPLSPKEVTGIVVEMAAPRSGPNPAAPLTRLAAVLPTSLTALLVGVLLPDSLSLSSLNLASSIALAVAMAACFSSWE